ncbi:sterol desaturase family protein [Aquabacterium sp.]|uniref:sterol desaturase family protein n=1 Tax=Aquabacterium sp. TaxID=1872578 RepID=UPI0025BFEC39|nr:sterol desaturase family protein [Aquabacterium sp.]
MFDALLSPLLTALTSLVTLVNQALGRHTDLRDWLLVALAPLFLLAVAIEWWRWRGQGRHHVKDTLASLNLGGVYTLVDVALVLTLVLPAMDWVWAHSLTRIALTPLSFAALYLGVELCYYGFHRASHRIRWFWCAHVVHHGSTFMNFGTAMRQSWLYGIAGNWLFYLPMVWIGFEPRWVLFALSCNLAYQFFVHTRWVGRLHPAIEFVFNTPSHHRAHHGRNPRYIDRNYGGTLIVFDRLFGTFVEETEPVDYGLVRPVYGHNPLWLTLHEWVAMGRDMLAPGPLSLRLRHLWAPPEWARPGRSPDNAPHASERPH